MGQQKRGVSFQLALATTACFAIFLFREGDEFRQAEIQTQAGSIRHGKLLKHLGFLLPEPEN